MERRLAAILAADVVEYSRMMGRDEAGTYAAVKACHQDLIDPTIARHHGRMVRHMGDGTLAEFPSVVEATQCAVDIQRAMAESNASQPDDKQLWLRIGINLGDIIVEDGDLYGDGVNVAARLEGFAQPAGICLSEEAFRQLGNRLDLRYEDRGAQTFKNIDRPVRVYQVRLDGGLANGTVAAPPPLRSRAWPWPVAAAAVLTFALVLTTAIAWLFEYLFPGETLALTVAEMAVVFVVCCAVVLVAWRLVGQIRQRLSGAPRS